MIFPDLDELTFWRIYKRLVTGEHEEVFAELAEEIDLARKLTPAEQKAADDAAKRGREFNKKLAEDVGKNQDQSNKDARKNWN